MKTINKTLIALIFLSVNLIYATDISGIYIARFKKNDNYIEVFKKNGKYYAYGLGNKNEIDKNINPKDSKKVVFLWNLEEKKDNKFDEGIVFNPDNNKKYHASAKVKDGYLRVSISKDFTGTLGKTLKWKKVSESQAKKLESKRANLDSLELPE